MVGSRSNYIDTQDISLRNNTDSLTYDQLSDVFLDSQGAMFFHQLTNDTIDKTFGLSVNAIEGNIMATQPEIAALWTLRKTTNAKYPTKEWELTYKDQSGNSTTYRGNAILQKFTQIDDGVINTTWNFRLEALEGFDIV